LRHFFTGFSSWLPVPVLFVPRLSHTSLNTPHAALTPVPSGHTHGLHYAWFRHGSVYYSCGLTASPLSGRLPTHLWFVCLYRVPVGLRDPARLFAVCALGYTFARAALVYLVTLTRAVTCVYVPRTLHARVYTSFSVCVHQHGLPRTTFAFPLPGLWMVYAHTRSRVAHTVLVLLRYTFYVYGFYPVYVRYTHTLLCGSFGWVAAVGSPRLRAFSRSGYAFRGSSHSVRLRFRFTVYLRTTHVLHARSGSVVLPHRLLGSCLHSLSVGWLLALVCTFCGSTAHGSFLVPFLFTHGSATHFVPCLHAFTGCGCLHTLFVSRFWFCVYFRLRFIRCGFYTTSHVLQTPLALAFSPTLPARSFGLPRSYWHSSFGSFTQVLPPAVRALVRSHFVCVCSSAYTWLPTGSRYINMFAFSSFRFAALIHALTHTAFTTTAYKRFAVSLMALSFFTSRFLCRYAPALHVT